MNNWIMFGLLMLVVLEVIFILIRVRSESDDWVFHKIISLFITFFIAGFQLIIVTENTDIGEPIIFRWEFLFYEFYIILAVITIFIINYFISRLVDKFAKGGTK